MNTSILSQLKQNTQQDWEAAVNSRFVQELAAGTIADQVLADYLVQDYQFCESFLQVMGQCVVSADTFEARLIFSRQLGFVSNSEDTYFQDCFTEFKVAEIDQTKPVLKPATEGFVALMQECVAQRSYPQLLAFLVVAEGLYLDWALRASDNKAHFPSRPAHRRWFDLHMGTDFENWVQWLIDELERVAQPDDPNVASVFARSVALENQFFVEAY